MNGQYSKDWAFLWHLPLLFWAKKCQPRMIWLGVWQHRSVVIG